MLTFSFKKHDLHIFLFTFCNTTTKKEYLRMSWSYQAHLFKSFYQNLLIDFNVLSHIVANLCEEEFHAMGIFVVDDIDQFCQFLAYLHHLS